MKITKYLHSCVLIEHDGKKLLFDPGSLTFNDVDFKPEDVGPVDVILLTHSHPDHLFPKFLKRIPTKKIITHQEIADLLKQESIEVEVIEKDGVKVVEGFTIKAVETPHGSLPVAVPYNLGYIINDSVYNPGDSYARTDIRADVLLLPIVSPWGTLNDAVAFATKLNPKQVIPVHEAIYIEYMRDRMSEVVGKKLTENGIEYQSLASGQSLTI
jgi:L-ascorbate metabolism protein UlaG (beta-lactamase superfamily)